MNATNILIAKRVVSGSWGDVWLDGDKLFDIEKFEVKATAEREDVPTYGFDIDSKIVAVKCEITLTLSKVYSRGAMIGIEWQKGIDVRPKIIGNLDDPDAYGAERIVINNAWFNDATLFALEKKKKLSEEMKLGCTLSSIRFDKLIS